MLESLEVKKAYRNARQELANALYREDAATRAIARIMKERDESRSALASIQATIGVAAPVAAQTDDVEMDAAGAETEKTNANGLPAAVEKVFMDTNAALSATRRKRKPAPGYVTADDVRSYTQLSTVPSLHATKPAGVTALDLSVDGSLALTGGADKTVQIYDFSTEKTLATLKGHTKAVKQVAFSHQSQIQDGQEQQSPAFAVSGSADKTVKVWSSNAGAWSLSSTFSTGTGKAAGEVVGISVHPSNKFVAAGSSAGTWSIHDIESGSTVKTYDAIPDDKGSFDFTSLAGHPDGILHGLGTKDGIVRVWDARDASALAAVLDDGFGAAVNSLSFSENGYYLGASTLNSVKIFDLRKLSTLKTINLPAENKIHEIRFDSSAQFLTVVGTDARVYANKSFEELSVFDDNAGELTGARFGALGSKLVLSGLDRTLRVLGKAQ